jgi:glycosyltransferase involved in cell wall biosynthesis
MIHAGPVQNADSDNARSRQSVSAIIPSYNSATVLPAAIESVVAQSHNVDAIIVVDDGSSDDTRCVCAQSSRPVQYHQQANAGASTARNTGAANARGEWLAFLDADDVWLADKIQCQFQALARHPEAVFSVTRTEVWAPSQERYEEMGWDGSLDPVVMVCNLLVRNIFTGLCSSLLIRRDAFDAIGGFAAGKACEDRRIAIELLQRYQGVIVDLPLVRQQPGPAHWTDPQRHRGEMLLLIEEYAQLYKRLDPSGRLQRKAIARVDERTGMHYLENGDVKVASKYLRSAVWRWPWMKNPWRFLINASLGRLRVADSTD